MGITEVKKTMVTINSRSQEFTIDSSTTEISADHTGSPGKRVRLILVNISTAAQVIKIAVGQEAGANLGIPLSVGGHIEWIQDVLPITQARVTAYSSAAGGLLSVYEEVIA